VHDTIYVRTSWGGNAQFSLSTQEKIEAGFEAERVVQEFGDVEEADLQNSTFALERTTLDSPIAPRRGTRFRLSGAEVFKTEILRPPGKRTSRASVAEARGEWHQPLTSATGLFVRLVGAGRFSSDRILQVYERTPIGGAATLRGYDEEAFRVDRYGLSRVEWSRFLGGQGQRAFLFWDHGWMATRLADEAGGDHLQVQNRDGLGFGLELQAAGGLVGIDYGLAPGNAPLEGRIHLQLITTF
jgi:hemolysin activation/secretion protein